MRPRPGTAGAAAVVLALLVGACGGDASDDGSSAPSSSRSATPADPPTAVVAAERIAYEPAAAVRPPQPILAPAYVPGLVADHCTDRDVLAPPTVDAHLTVLDRTYALSANYVPPDLVPASAAGFSGVEGDRLVSAALVDNLTAMRDAWLAEGLTITLRSAYRSYVEQAHTFDLWVRTVGYDAALLRAARAGHSEHQLGTGIDVLSPGWEGRFGDWATESAEGAWMAANAWRYGFVMSYPAGAEAETCFGYEPWHFRWVGREAAAEQRAEGITLRMYLVRFVSG